MERTKVSQKYNVKVALNKNICLLAPFTVYKNI